MPKSTKQLQKRSSSSSRRVVAGVVTNKQKAKTPFLIVRAFSVDLKKSALLGETLTDQTGKYQIAYESTDRPVHLQIEVLSFTGESLARSDVHFSAGKREVINLSVDALAKLTEYEQISGAVRLATADTADQPLLQDDAPFLLERLNRLPYSLPFVSSITEARIRIWLDGESLATATGIPGAFYYGIARVAGFKPPLALASYAELSQERLRLTLQEAIKKQITPDVSFDSVSALVDEFSLGSRTLLKRRFTGRIVDDTTSTPLEKLQVRATQINRNTVLGQTLTDPDGIFLFNYLSVTDQADEFKLEISDLLGTPIETTTVKVDDPRGVREIRLRLEAGSDDSPDIAEVNKTIGLILPDGLAAFLKQRGIRTLKDLLAAGGFRNIADLPVDKDHPALRQLDAHANLSVLSGYEPLVADSVIQAGFENISSIARTDRPTFVQSVQESVKPYRAASLLKQAQVGEALLQNMLTNIRVDRFPATADGDVQTSLRAELAQDSPESCRCSECETVAGFAAYLVDLIDYAVAYVKDNGAKFSVEDLEQTFFQHFKDLPLSCDQVHTTVAQVRICIEVLRRYLTAKSLPAAGSPAETRLNHDYATYLDTAYASILRRLGASLDDLREALLGDNANTLRGLARRLGLSQDASLQDFILDIDSLSLSEIERELEHVFGLADTQRDPFSAGVKLGDAQNQILRWNFEGVVWRKNTDEDGHIYLTISQPSAGLVRIQAFRDEARLEVLASGDAAADGSVILVPPDPGDNQPGSALRGTLQLQFLAEDNGIRISAVPLLVSRQLQFLYSQWLLLDDPAQPLLDPDLVGLGELQTPLEENEAFFIWKVRSTEIAARLGFLRSLSASAGDADPLAALLAETNVDLAGSELNAQEREYLQRIHNAVTASDPLPVLNIEWENVISILVQVEKRRQREEWAAEEQAAGIKLTPDLFRLPESLSLRVRELPPFRARAFDFRRFQQKLQSRTEERARLFDAHEKLIGDVEQDVLRTLRDALIIASDASGTTLAEKADFITENLLINARMDVCQTTTRVAQAAETLQTFLWSVRIGLFNDSRPGLDLYSPDFDEEWKWIGSYDAWRAAMMVFLYPENVLDPTLRRPQTPAFKTCVRAMRDNPRLTPAKACKEAQTYAVYVNEIAAITIDASCQARAPFITEGGCAGEGIVGTTFLTFLFGRSENTGNVYMSTYRPGVATGYDQSFWRPIPELQGVAQILGAPVYEISATRRYIYVFAKKTSESKDTLIYARWNLEAQKMEPGGPFHLDLPDGVTTFSAVIQQSNDVTQPPAMALLFNDRVFIKRLTREGNELDPAVQPDPDGSSFHAGDGTPLKLVAMVALDVFPGRNYLFPQFFLLIGTNETKIFFKLFRPANENELSTNYAILPIERLANGSWKGSFFWPAGPNLVNLVYTFWTQNGILKYSAIFFKGIAQRVPDDPNLSLGELPALNSLERIAVDSGARAVMLLNRTIAYQLTGVNKGPFLGFFSRDPNKAVGSVLEGLAAEVSGTATASQIGRVSFRMNTGLGAQIGDDDLVIGLGGGGGVGGGGGGANPPPEPPILLPVFEVNRLRLAPLFREPVKIVQRLTESELQIRKAKIAAAFQDNSRSSRSNISYLEEAFYLVPVLVALQLQRRGHYLDALDWFRTVYDFTQPGNLRKIYFGLVLEESLPWNYERNVTWLLEPLNPHAIAVTRRNTYTRFTLRSLARCFSDFADSEFARDTPESVARAHLLYSTALDLLNLDELSPEPTACETTLDELDQGVTDGLGIHPHYIQVAWADVVNSLSGLGASSNLQPAAASVRAELNGEGDILERLSRASRAVNAAIYAQPGPATISVIREEIEDKRTRARAILLRQPDVITALNQVSEVVVADLDHTVTSLTGQDKATVQTLDLPWLASTEKRVQLVSAFASGSDDGISHLELLSRVAQSQPLPVFTANQKLKSTFFVTPQDHFCIPANPAITSLRLQVELNLEKIRGCRNISGLERDMVPYGLQTSVVSALDRRGDVILPEALQAPPTVFRFRTLIERAKQLVALAQQLEATFLSILEKRDAEYYNLLKARQDLTLSLAGIRLQQLGLAEARDNVRLSDLQFERAQSQADHYADLLGESESTMEKLALVATSAVMIGVGIKTHDVSAVVSGITTLGGFLTGSDDSKRREELQQALKLAKKDVQIGAQSIRLADDRVKIRAQELNIGNLQSSHAQETLEFLVNKFMNAELYDWMSGVIEDVYRSFLQQATSVAQLGANQLSFERQEAIPRFIQADYWEALMGQQSGFTDEDTTDRRGLTGSARLLQDIFQLDQYAFDTEQRKQQLTKTFSLARMAPAEFQRFREDGVLHFVTLLPMFDVDFPGHFLRLIKRLRVSVIALIPPTEGIKATLSSGGISQAVTRNGSFRETSILRQPETVSLTSAINATGEFELSIQPENDLLHPFEGNGVAADWTFELPKAANQFDFQTIADVLVTLDYTALASTDYRKEVVERLGREFSGDRTFTFRFELSDQWFDLNNPDQTPTPMSVRFATRREDFLPNLSALEVRQVILFFSLADGESFEVEVTNLLFTPAGETTPLGGGAISDDAVISTRRGNANNWLPMIGHAPIGDWVLSFPDTEEVRQRFREELIRDILLVITHSAITPEWP